MDIPTILFWLTAILTGVCAIGVVVTQNVVRMATWLLFSLAGTSGIFFLLGFDFVGATQLFVYVGGTLVLVVFGVMLTAQGPFISMKTGSGEWAIATLVGLLLFGILAVTIFVRMPNQPGTAGAPEAPANSRTSAVLGESLIGLTEATPRGQLTNLSESPTKPTGESRKQMAYLLPFEIVSVHLLVVLIGAAYLARAKRRRVRVQ